MLTHVFIGVNFTPGIISPEQQKTLEFCLQIFHCLFVIITDDGVSHCLRVLISLQILFTCLSTRSAQLCVGSQLRYNHRPRASPKGSGEENTRSGHMSEWSDLTVCLGQNPILQHGHQERGPRRASVYSFPWGFSQVSLSYSSIQSYEALRLISERSQHRL